MRDAANHNAEQVGDRNGQQHLPGNRYHFRQSLTSCKPANNLCPIHRGRFVQSQDLLYSVPRYLTTLTAMGGGHHPTPNHKRNPGAPPVTTPVMSAGTRLVHEPCLLLRWRCQAVFQVDVFGVEHAAFPVAKARLPALPFSLRLDDARAVRSRVVPVLRAKPLHHASADGHHLRRCIDARGVSILKLAISSKSSSLHLDVCNQSNVVSRLLFKGALDQCRNLRHRRN